MTVTSKAKLLLPEDLLLIPVPELSPDARAKLEALDSDVAVTRPLSRTPSSIIDADSAELLARFRSPRTIVEAVVDFSKSRSADPHAVLEGALPVLRRLISAHLLVPIDGELTTKPIVGSFERGDRVGDYEILRRISVLLDVEVYQARAADGSLVLIKHARTDGGERIAHSLAREARLLTRVAGAGVPRLVHAGKNAELPYLAIEWRRGIDPVRAAAAWREAGTADARRQLLQLCVRVVQLYDRLHALDVAHGDVHPRNLLVDRNGAVSVIDFGAAYDLEGDGDEPPSRVGVLEYHDPDLAAAFLDGRAGPSATRSSDQFSVGALLFNVLVGAPYLDLSVRRRAALEQIVKDPPGSFAARGAAAWPEVERVVGRMLEKDPIRRFASMGEAADALRAVSIDAAPSIRPPHAVLPDRLFARLLPQAPAMRERLPVGPMCSVNNGAAGIAHAWYRVALFREDPSALAAAAAWGRRAISWMELDEAFFLRDQTITPDTVGRAGLFHSATGVHCVNTLIAHASAEPTHAARSIERYAEAARVRCSKWDLTLGRAGALLGCALQVEADPGASRELRRVGSSMNTALLTRVKKAGSIRASRLTDAIGIAHGWAGTLFTLFRWTQATGTSVDPIVAERSEELAAHAIDIGRGRAWPRFIDRVDDSLQATWCNGDAGMVFFWLTAHQALGGERFRHLAEDAGWSVADRGPEPMLDLCCGAAGRAYALLALYRATGDDEWLRRAKRFAAHAAAHVDFDAPDAHRLYKGALGVALLLIELEDPTRARMPLFEAEGWAWPRAGTRA